MQIIKVWFDEGYIYIKTNVGHIIGNPLSWFPSLLKASPEQRNNFYLGQFGIHWEELDEDLSLEGFFTFKIEKEEDVSHSSHSNQPTHY
jgi:hypothetical protein